MKDIDFDELDRAVSSVLGKDAMPPAPKKTDEADKTSVRDESAAVKPMAPSEPTDSTEPVASDQPAAPAKPAQKPFVQKRTSGRFMDVVHPSSDMKSQNAKPSIPRHSATISPLTSTTKDETTLDESAPATLRAAEAEVDDVLVTDDNETAKTAEHDTPMAPDPLDFHAFPDESLYSDEADEPESPTVEEEESPTVVSEDDGYDDDEEDDDTDIALEQATSELSELNDLMEDHHDVPPLDTPFVNDLAVEKRPLGAFSVGDTDATLLSDDALGHMTAAADAMSSEKTADDSEQTNTDMQSAIKNELDKHEEAGSVSSFVSEQPDIAEETENEKDDAQTATDAEAVPEELQEDIVAIESREITPSPSAPLAATSIPQQYTQKPTEQSEEVTPVFDTTDYHQPLKHADKKKSGWLYVVLIVLLVVLGAGGGAAVYFFDPFNLF